MNDRLSNAERQARWRARRRDRLAELERQVAKLQAEVDRLRKRKVRKAARRSK
jgi:uncharacterized small protein (DUF1192 family)